MKKIAGVAAGFALAATAACTPAAAVVQARTYVSATSANIRCDPPNPPRETAADTRLVKTELGGLIGTQENCAAIQPSVLGALGTGWGHYIPRPGGIHTGPREVPIFWPTSSWAQVSRGYTNVGDTQAAVWVLLRNRATGQRLIRVNTHWVAGAWKDPAKMPTWLGDQAHTEALIRTLHAAHPGAVLIVGGDFNAHEDVTLLPALPHVVCDVHVGDLAVLHMTSPHVAVVKDTVIPTRSTGGPLYTDHDAVSAEYVLR